MEKLNPPIKLKKENDPLKSFIRQIGLRDKAVHFKPQFHKSVQDKSKGSDVSYTYFNFNYNKAKFGLDVISKMITFAAENCNLPFPEGYFTKKVSLINRQLQNDRLTVSLNQLDPGVPIT